VTDLPATAPSPPPSAAAPEIVIEVEGLTKSFNGRTVVKGLTMQVDLRLPRPERQRQDDDHPYALRPADA